MNKKSFIVFINDEPKNVIIIENLGFVHEIGAQAKIVKLDGKEIVFYKCSQNYWKNYHK